MKRPIALVLLLALGVPPGGVVGLGLGEDAQGAPLGPPAPPPPSGLDVRSPLVEEPGGQTATAPRGGEGGDGAEILWLFPPEQTVDRSLLKVHVSALRRERASGNGGLLRDVRALGWVPGAVRLIIPGEGERLVRVGDRIGADTVTHVDDHRLRLTRPDSGQPGPAHVVVSFDAEGQPFVRVYSRRNPPSPDPGQNEAQH
jgi:hypothetical protein